MTALEQRAILALRDVKMPEKNWHAKRAELLHARLSMYAGMKLLVSEQADLWFLVWRYRRQIDDGELVGKANELVNGALSLGF